MLRRKTGSFRETFSKNTFYRFLNDSKINWLRFTTLLSKKVADTVEPLTNADRVNAFIVDDSLFLFDTWFSNPAQIIAVKNLGLDSIAMIKKSSRVYYEYEGEQLSIKKIFGISKKHRGRSKYLLSVNVMIGKEQKIPAKIVCARNKKNKKDWIAFICTNPDLFEEEIIRNTLTKAALAA